MMKNLYNLVYENAEQNNKEEEYYRKGFEYFASSVVFSQMKFGQPGLAFRRLPNGSYIDVRIVDNWYPGLVVSELEESIKPQTFVAIIHNRIHFLNSTYGLHRLEGPAVLPLLPEEDDGGTIANCYFAYGISLYNETFDISYYYGVLNKSKQVKRELTATVQSRLVPNIMFEINRLLTTAKYQKMSVKEVCDLLLPTFNPGNPPFTKTIHQTAKISGDEMELKFIVTNSKNKSTYLQKFKESISKQYSIGNNESRTVKI